MDGTLTDAASLWRTLGQHWLLWPAMRTPVVITITNAVMLGDIVIMLFDRLIKISHIINLWGAVSR